MTYKQGCKHTALLGIPCLLFDVIARLPPLYHVQAVHRTARIILSGMAGGELADRAARCRAHLSTNC
jgi:hypothetical protein